MRTLRIAPSLAALLLLASGASAQSGDWQAVKTLPLGTKISVSARHRFIHTMCIFQGVTDDELTCEVVRHSPNPFLPSEIKYPRQSIRQVRLEHSDGANTAAGAAIGGGIGAAVGGSTGNGTLTRQGGALLFGGIGAIVGGFAGRDFPMFHGKVVYRGPEPRKR